jgi:hypothetical protein
MEKTTEVEVLKTSDLFAAAYLIVKGFPLIKPPYLNKKGFVVYTFNKTPELESAWNQLDSRSDSVEPLSILEQYRYLRAQSAEIRKRSRDATESRDAGELGGGDNE